MGQKNLNLSAILLATLLGIQGRAETPIGLVGGITDDINAYAAFVFSGNPDLISLPGLPDEATILSVSINSSGTGLIGGQILSSIPYAAIVVPNTATPFVIPFSNGNILSVAINESGFGLIGGIDNHINAGYAAQVSSDGTLQPPLSISADVIEQVALNDSGVGLIGGASGDAIYAAFVAPDGTVTPVSGTPPAFSHIYAVAINSLGNGIIGGFGQDLNASYAAFVTAGGGSPIELSPIPSGASVIRTVAINDGGFGLIGGFDMVSGVYAGYSDPTGAVTTLSTPFGGTILDVALNNSGIGLIGGQNVSNFYAVLVQPDGTLTPLFPDPISGAITSVALNNEGLGLIGGQATEPLDAYVALVAPNGTLTVLNASSAIAINSVSLSNPEEIFNQVTPKALNPFSSVIYTQLAANKALNNRFIEKNKVWRGAAQINAYAAAESFGFEGEIASSGDVVWGNPKQNSAPKNVEEAVCKPNSIWLEPFGDLIYLENQGSSIPNFSNEVGGALLGYDHEGSNYLIGATLGYAFNYVGFNLGHSKIQEEMASLYGAYYTDHFWMGLALWGGVYQVKNIRHTPLHTTSKGKSHGWVLDPHVELASPWAMDVRKLYYVEPFVALDWVNNWQHHYAETGTSGLNLKVPGIHNSLLQSEIGLRFYENFILEKGEFHLEEKLSYINQAPFGKRSVGASFVSSASTFPVAIASSKVENLGAVQFLGCFIPNNSSYYVGFSFQATAGSSYQSYFASLFTGVDF